MGNTTALPEVFKQGMQDFVIPELVSAPNTTIVNRAKVSNSLKAFAGVERVMFRSINQLPNEFGPNGERVFEIDSKDSRIRFVGGWQQRSDTIGSTISGEVDGCYVEVTAYSTGLNILFNADGATSPSIQVGVDGGAVGSNLISGYSTIIDQRGYGSNHVLVAVSGLTLGWHTYKVLLPTTNSATRVRIYGFEVVNDRANIAVAPGKAVAQGSPVGLSVLSTSAFKNGVVGSRGARVVKYVQNGILSQAVQEVDSSSKFLTLADHTNEEALRRINWREFGANRVDDFSTMSGTTVVSRAFTLDDGTTTLVGSNVGVGNGGTNTTDLRINNTAGATYFITLSFVGSGLDIVAQADSVGTTANMALIVDGVSQGNIAPTFTNNVDYKKISLCSGLAYGTHTVKINLTATTAAANLNISDFIIYQPKKPSIPVGAFEVADYNVVADHTPSTSGNLTPSIGVLRKLAARELNYAGTFTSTGIDINWAGGMAFYSLTDTNYIEIPFYGTGIECKTLFGGAALNRTYSIDGSSNLSAYQTNVYSTAIGSITLVAATGVLSGTSGASTYGDTVSIRNLPLGWHKLRITRNSGYTFYQDAFDIITPIHINESSLKIGSQSLRSNQNYDVMKTMTDLGPDLGKAKAWVTYNPVTQTIISSYNISAVLKTGTGFGILYFEKPFKNSGYVSAGSIYTNGEFLQLGGDNANVINKSPGSIGYRIFDYNGTVTETPFSAVFFGEQIDE